MIGFVVRLVAYGVFFGIVSRVAQTLWAHHGLDAVEALQPLHDGGVTALIAAPFVAALAGWGRLRVAVVVLAGVLAGAALTAPFALARLAAGG